MIEVGWDIMHKLPINGLLKVTNDADETFIGRVVEDDNPPYNNLQWIYISSTNLHHYGFNTLDGLHDNIYTGNVQFFIVDSEQERKELHEMLNKIYGVNERDDSVPEASGRIVDNLIGERVNIRDGIGRVEIRNGSDDWNGYVPEYTWTAPRGGTINLTATSNAVDTSVSIAGVSEADTSRPEQLRVRGRFEQIRPAIDPEVEREARARYGDSLVDSMLRGRVRST